MIQPHAIAISFEASQRILVENMPFIILPASYRIAPNDQILFFPTFPNSDIPSGDIIIVYACSILSSNIPGIEPGYQLIHFN